MSGIEGPGITGGGGSAPSTEDFVTYSSEAGLPNSRVLTAGTNITLDTSTPGQISVSASASGTPGAPDTSVQYNNAGAFGGSAKLTWNDTVSLLTVGNATGGVIGTGTTGSVFVSGGNPLTDTTTGFFAAGGGGGTSGNGGAITITAGSGQTAGSGGGVSINSGAGVGGSNAGSVTIAAGSATGGGTSGSVVLHAGGANRLVLFSGGELGIDGSNGTAGNVPVSAGAVGAVTWGTVNLASSNAVTGDLPFSNIAQGAALSVLGVTGNATADLASIAAASDGNVLRRSGTAVGFGAIALTSSNAVSGILPAANGGTGNGFTAFSGPATSTKTFTLPNASATILTNDATVTVAQGGTGISGYTQGDLIFAAGTSTLTTLGKSATATRYLSNTGASNNPAWAQVDLTNGVTGNLPVANLNSGTSASSSTFWRGDATWATPVAGGSVAGSDTQIQFNNSGAFGADADLTWTASTNTLALGSNATPAIIDGITGGITIRGGINSNVGQAVTVSGRSASTGNSNGGAGTYRAGNSAGSGTPGDATLQGGASGGAAAGGSAIVQAGASGSANGGAVAITATAGNTNGNGGSVTITSGVKAGSGTDGDFIFQTGSSQRLKYDVTQARFEVGTTSIGEICGQQGTSPADLDVHAGNNTAANGAGGAMSVRGGLGTGTGAGGLLTLAGGFGGSSGAGGGVLVRGRDGGGGSTNGGSINITAGVKAGGGTDGTITFNIGTTQIGTLDTAPTTGAQTATFSATNKPGSATAGPTNWLKFINGGTTYWIPLFGN